jgi:hypothetical protein
MMPAVTVVSTVAPHVSGEERLCRYFPPGKTWHYADRYERQWRSLTSLMPRPLRHDSTVLAAFWNRDRWGNPGILWRRVNHDCNP